MSLSTVAHPLHRQVQKLVRKAKELERSAARDLRNSRRRGNIPIYVPPEGTGDGGFEVRAGKKKRRNDDGEGNNNSHGTLDALFRTRSALDRATSELRSQTLHGKIAALVARKKERQYGKPESRKQIRAGERIREILIQAIASNDIKKLARGEDVMAMGEFQPLVDPTRGAVYPEIMDVQLSSDMKRATIYWSPPFKSTGEEPDEIEKRRWAKRFEQARGEIRSLVGKSIKSRFVPEIEFRLDNALATLKAVDELVVGNDDDDDKTTTT